MKESKRDKRKKIRYRIRKTTKGDAVSPRLSVFRSNKEIYAQLIDDQSGTTITSASSNDTSIRGKKVNKVDKAKLVGMLIAEKAKSVGIKSVKFDRGGFLYHGRIKSFAEGARETGLNF